MVNKEYLKFIKKGDHISIFNYTNGITFQVHATVFEKIKNCNNKEDFIRLADAYSDENKDFINTLWNSMEETNVLIDCRKGKLKLINYVITDSCNLYCKHCCFSAKLSNSSTKPHVNIDIIKKIIGYNPDTLIITGGEPLLVENILDILRWLKENYIGAISLSTNATLINESNVQFLCDTIDNFDISVDGLTAEKADRIRGKGTFDKVMAAINLLKTHGAKKMSLSDALTDETKDDDGPFRELCEKLEVKPLVRRMGSVGRAKENNLSFSTELHRFKTSSHFSPNLCTAGTEQITVNYNGDVYPCSNFIEDRFIMCNILVDDIAEHLGYKSDYPWFKNFSQYIPYYREECKNCEVNQYCWTCPLVIKLLEDNTEIKKLTSICSEKKDFMMKVFDQ